AAAPQPSSAKATASKPPAQSEGSMRASQAPSGTMRTPSGRILRGRVTGDELITSLFESMHDLHFLRDALEGGQFCLSLVNEVLPARAALIHFFDVEKRHWVVACARGKEAPRVLGTHTAETDPTLRDAARRRRALVVANADDPSADRYKQL